MATNDDILDESSPYYDLLKSLEDQASGMMEIAGLMREHNKNFDSNGKMEILTAKIETPFEKIADQAVSQLYSHLSSQITKINGQS